MGASDLGATFTWDQDLRLVEAQPNGCARLARRDAFEPGRTLAEALDVPEARAEAVDRRARAAGGVEFLRVGQGGEGGWLRLELARSGVHGQARALDLDAVLLGAPPVQISRLSSSLSHELRNPLSSVKMAVQTLARNADLSSRDQRRLTIAQREIRTMERMLWMLSEYGRESALNVEGRALREVVQQATALIAPELEERKIALQIDERPDLPAIRADVVRMRPVLAQLFLNVAAGLAPGAGLAVALNADARGGASLRVADPSAALPPEERDSLFEPFGSRLARGAGLSLAALRQVMLHQDGWVTAEGSTAPGTVFTLHFARA